MLHFLVGYVLNFTKSKSMSKLQVTTWNSHCKLSYTTQACVQQNSLIISQSFLMFKYTYFHNRWETRDHATPVTENDHCCRICEYMKHSIHMMQSHSAYPMDTQKTQFWWRLPLEICWCGKCKRQILILMNLHLQSHTWTPTHTHTHTHTHT